MHPKPEHLGTTLERAEEPEPELGMHPFWLGGGEARIQEARYRRLEPRGTINFLRNAGLGRFLREHQYH